MTLRLERCYFCGDYFMPGAMVDERLASGLVVRKCYECVERDASEPEWPEP